MIECGQKIMREETDIYRIGSEINLLEPEFYTSILAHPEGKMRIIQETNKVAL